MWRKRILSAIEKNQREIRGLVFRKYPAFILTDRVNGLAGIPAFVFHEVTPSLLEPMLGYLAENAYATLTADEYVERQARGERGQEREVLLTFDDGLKSLYSVAYPLLKRYGLKAVAYIVPGTVPEGNASRKEDAWEKNLCTWQEIREMHNSGVIDFQSHSMYHHSIPITKRVLDFVRPGVTCSFIDSDFAPLDAGSQSTGSAALAYGTPIHKWWSRFGDQPAFRESRAAVEACVDYVKQYGGAPYFLTSEWRRRLKAVLAEARRKDTEANFETEAEQQQAILDDFRDSKRELERRLPTQTVRHFCFPWFRGSPLAVRLSADAGYVSNAWASLPPSFARQHDVIIPVARLFPTYIWRLPGLGRRALSEVVRERLVHLRVRPPHSQLHTPRQSLGMRVG